VSVDSSANDDGLDAAPIAALSLRRELARKGLHLLSTVVPVAYAVGVSRGVVVWVLAFALAIAVAIEVGRSRSRRARGVFHNTVGGLLREHEWHGPSGATWLVLALLDLTPVVLVYAFLLALANFIAALGQLVFRSRT